MLTYSSSEQSPTRASQTSIFQRTAECRESAVLCVNLQGELTSCNAGFASLTGYRQEELVGKELSTLFARASGASENDCWRDIVAAVDSQGNGRAALEILPRKGDRVPVEVSASYLRDGRSQPVAIVVIVDAGAGASDNDPPQAASSNDHRIISRHIGGTEFILASPVMHKFLALVERVASHTETVLITGETGAGKEMIARSIHEGSQRRSRPWVDINCAALPENLVESELFGYEKGAFSGADSSKPGLFELADKGTLFLDEIGELQLHTQVKLLRVLDGQPFYRLGGNRKIIVDVRVVAATNRDLAAEVREGRFRQDLFHRLGQFQLHLPPLRERPEDIVALAEHFLKLKAPTKSFSPQAISVLISHAWPGNIRELRNLVARVAMESPDRQIDVAQIKSAFGGEPATRRQIASMPVSDLESMEEQMILKALERTGGQKALAAEQLGISRRTLSRKLKEYNITALPTEAKDSPLGMISSEQQKFFRARVQVPVTLRNAQGDEISVQAVNLSNGGMGLEGFKEPLKFSGLLDIRFVLPESDVQFKAKARVMWVGEDGRVGIRFAVIEPAIFEQLQRWTNHKMKEEGWDFPT